MQSCSSKLCKKTVSRRFWSDRHIFQTMYGMPFGPGAELLRFRFRTDGSSEKDGGHCLKADVGSSQAGKSLRDSKTDSAAVCHRQSNSLQSDCRRHLHQKLVWFRFLA